MARISRRAVHKLLLAAPGAAVASAGAAAQTRKPSAFAACIAGAETSLSAAERKRLATAIAGLEGALEVIRGFKVPADTEPAMHFRPLGRRRAG